MLTTICFDADDTLWHNERFFQLTQERFAGLLADYVEADDLAQRLIEAETRNLGHYGFGIKGFVLSMIETALEVSGNKVPGDVVKELITVGQEMLRHPIELLPDAGETVRALAADFTLLLVTKGDLLDQERKLAQSGLGENFDGVEIVSDKTAAVYSKIFARNAAGPSSSLMVGNSLKSDVFPALEAGGWGVHVPHDLTWPYEQAVHPATHVRYRKIDTLGALPDLILEISRYI